MTGLILMLATLSLASYEDAYRESIRLGKPLVVGVGCAPHGSYGEWVPCLVSRLEGYKAPCIVVSVPKGDTLYWHATLPAAASFEDIRRSLAPPAKKYDPYQPRSSLPIRSAGAC